MRLVESETLIFPNRPWYLGSGLVRKVAAPTSDPVRSGNVLEPSDHELRTYGQLDHLSGASPGEWGGKVPDVAVGKIRNPWMVILLSIITLGIYALYWQYASFKEMKEHAGEGIGGGLGLLFAILLGIVNVFLLPSEVGNLYAKEGRERPISGLTGFWVLLPIIGGIIWVVKTQGRLNDYWEAHGATAA